MFSLNFDFVNIFLLFIAALNLGLTTLLFFQTRGKEINVVYAVNCLAVLIWILTAIFYRSAPSEYSLELTYALYIVATFIPSVFLFFTYLFPKRENINIRIRAVVIFLSVIVFSFLTTIPNFFIESISIPPNTERLVSFGSYYWIYVIYVGGLFLYGFYRLQRKYKGSSGIERSQILYLLLGASLTANIALITNVLLPWAGYFVLNWFGEASTIIMVGFTTYAILQYQLMDIRIVVRKVFIYIGEAAFVYIVFFGVVAAYDYWYGGIFNKNSYITSIVVAQVFIITFYYLDTYIKRFANRYFFAALYNAQETLTNLSSKLSTYIDLDVITTLIVDTIQQTMQLDNGGIVLKTTDPQGWNMAKVIGFDEHQLVQLLASDILATHLLATHRPLLRDEFIQTMQANAAYEHVIAHIKDTDVQVLLPLVNNTKLLGVIVLGPKISRDAYTQEDIELLEALSREASITIANALQYRQIQEFGHVLESKVNEQTKSLQNTNEELELKNNLNQELLEMKSDFLRVVNHQLNTPISIMRGYFNMMKEGTYTPEKALPIVESGLDRIGQTVSDFWDAYELEGQRMKMNPVRVDITSIVDKMIEEKKNLKYTKDRNLTLTVQQPDFPVPIVWCDMKKITHVISNLLDNAVFYTYKGGIVVYYEVVGSFLTIRVKDSGSGISDEDKKRLFQKFTRGSRASGMHPDGSGLGLYIAKKIVEGGGGEISFASEGLGKGTTFSFTVPIYTNQQGEDTGEVMTSRKNKIEIFN